MIERLGKSGWNFLVSSGSEAATRVLSTLAVVLLARYLQPTGFGAYSTVLAYYALVLSLGGMGLDRLILRELSTQDSESPPRLGTLLGLRTGAAVIFGATGFATCLVFKSDWLPLIGIAAAALIPASIGSTYAAVFQGRERFGIPSAAAVAAAVTTACTILIGVAMGAPLIFFLGTLVVGESVRAVWLVVAARELSPSLGRFDPTFALQALRGSIPYGLLAVLGTIYFRIDLVMLEAMSGVEVSGLYASAYRILEVFGIMPALVLGVLFPRFARLLQQDHDQARQLYLYASRVLVWLGLALALFGILSAGSLVDILYTPQYHGAAHPLRWLMLALLFLFAHATNATVLFAGTQLRRVVQLSFLTAAANVVANLALIPRYGAAGAAAATAGSELLSWAIFTVVVCRRLGISPAVYARSVSRPLLSRTEWNLLLGRSHEISTFSAAPK